MAEPGPNSEFVGQSTIDVPKRLAVDVAKLQGLMKERGILIDGGYGKIKGKTFRLSSMGDETEETMQSLYGLLDESIAQL